MGKIQGLKNDPIPARNAIPKLKMVSELIPPPIDVVKFKLIKILVNNSKLLIRDRVPVKTKIPRPIKTTPKKYWKYRIFLPKRKIRLFASLVKSPTNKKGIPIPMV